MKISTAFTRYELGVMKSSLRVFFRGAGYVLAFIVCGLAIYGVSIGIDVLLSYNKTLLNFLLIGLITLFSAFLVFFAICFIKVHSIPGKDRTDEEGKAMKVFMIFFWFSWCAILFVGVSLLFSDISAKIFYTLAVVVILIGSVMVSDITNA